MSWFKRNKGFEKIDDLDLSACFDSFNKHWQQTFEIIDRFQTSKSIIKYDDIVAVINHLNQLIKLLLLDVQSAKSTNQSRCLEYFLKNQLLGKLYSWSLKTDRYSNYLKLEQLKVYGVLLSEFRGHQLLSDDSILNPLLLILNSYDGDCLSVEIEKHLVTVLRQFCVVLSHHSNILSNVLKKNIKNSKCIILSLLMAFIHREGSIGEEARDALLIFMSLSRQNDVLANIIISKSNVSPVLATGLSGLYSVLPRKLDFENDCYRLSPENIEDVPELNNFLASVELCNAVAKICHKSVYDQLLDYLYHGFLLPVVGPALMQVAEEEVATATVYLDLLLRSVTHPGLLQTFVKFVLCERFEKVKIIELLINRINNRSFKVCISTLALMETVLDLNCEDVMLELVLKYLVPCTHIMLSQRSRIKQVDSYCKSADIFLSLIPDVFKHRNLDSQTLYSEYRCYLNCARIKISECAIETKHWTYLYDGENPSHTIVEIKTHEVENDQSSILSADDSSSGYESFKPIKDIEKMLGTDDIRPNLTDEMVSNTSSPCGSDSPTCFIRQSTLKTKEQFTHYPCLGPFLEALFSKLENMPEQDFRINLRLTAVITRLSMYNKPLIQSLLLNHSMIFQPCIRSLFQILRSLKQAIESKLNGRMDKIKEAETFLIERENKLSNTQTQSHRSSGGKNPEPFTRGETKRRSLSIAFGAMFRRNTGQKEAVLESTSNGYRYYKENEIESLDLPINAIILTEWLKELSAICQEHAIS
ncbi:Retinoic acid induced 16-like protein,Armadillo-like helical [Cinara cedri]|uniref:Retinoic acid induced 16-like protein,Armadillo-like helical n=1 Tax=Cinara cedri TaxID=506608 RepID=A0A5E4NLC7_9HEMI|nr:Retinoic acid induced 16-like protein,Armadillo-like helical [Cinara cedri]